jgi:BASS family bile acid:Na+ symporter
MKKLFLPLLFVAIVLGFILPGGQYLKPLLPWLLSTLLFFNFYVISFERKQIVQTGILLYFLIVLLVVPLLLFLATKSVSPSFRIGLFLTAITPSAISGPIVVTMLEGNFGLSIANTVVYNLFSPLSYTLLTKLYFNTSDLNVDFEQMILKLLVLICIPFGLALVAKRISRLTRPLQTIASYINILFLFIVFSAVSASSGRLQTISGTELLFVLLAVCLVVMALYLSGFLLGQDWESKKALAVSMGHKNNSLCIWLAVANFDPLAAIPPTVYIIVQHSVNALLILFFTRRASSRGDRNVQRPS